MTIQEQINEILKNKNISKYILSKNTEIDESQLSKFFNYKTNLSLKNIMKILDYLEYDILLVPKNKSI